jgi:hypothetical protein
MRSRPVAIRPGPRDAQQHAVSIAEKVTQAWYGRHGSSDVEVPVSVVAALSFLSPPHAERHGVAADLIKADVETFRQTIRSVWSWYVRARPDLVNRVWPLVKPWHSENYTMSDSTLHAAKAAADTALCADQLSLTGTDRRRDTDLLGVLLTSLRPKSTLYARGQFYTPPPVCELIARMLDVADGEAIHEPACGTGGNVPRCRGNHARARPRPDRSAVGRC